MPNFTFIDLFAGIGGFHQAMTQLGGECVMACEIDGAARQIYSSNHLGNHPHIRFANDITEFNERTARDVPNHDVLCAGFPCQPFSKSGKQLGINEARGTLFYNILTIVKAKQPSLIVLENVRNLAGPRHKDTFNTIWRLLNELGYYVPESPLIVSPHKLPAPFGAPQHRERVYIVAVKRTAVDYDNLPDIVEEMRKVNRSDWSVKNYCNTAETGPALTNGVTKAIDFWGELLRELELKSVKVPSFPLWSETWAHGFTYENVPDWKRKILSKNEEFFVAHQEILSRWLSNESYLNLTPTQRKLEWQCGNHWNIWDSLIQLRPSGIRVKRMTHFPAMVAINQRSILGEPYRRYISVGEGLRLQGFDSSFSFQGQSEDASFKQLGNAVNVGAVKFVVTMSQTLWKDRFPNDTVQLNAAAIADAEAVLRRVGCGQMGLFS
jgi:DNA (cytosine-5)-methyltransferase 1